MSLASPKIFGAKAPDSEMGTHCARRLESGEGVRDGIPIHTVYLLDQVWLGNDELRTVQSGQGRRSNVTGTRLASDSKDSH